MNIALETIPAKEFVPNLLEQEISGTDGTIIETVNRLIREAHTQKASDIHIDPSREHLLVRFRIDGMLRDVYRLPTRLHGELIARFKIMAGLRTDEHYTPHDGRFRFSITNELSVDIRISITPTYYGENAVLRLLIPFRDSDTLRDLGFSPIQETSITRAISRPHGLILATGPTGGGKTTTLYALIRLLNRRSHSIITIEDPVEYSIPGINQIQVNGRTGLSFSQGLRSILRQDPDVIMVGEIRDAETAKLAMNAALTGHLVFSTLHTNESAAVLPRLLDLDVEPYVIASTLSLVIAQRLVRRICESCRESYTATGIERQALSELLPTEPAVSIFYRGVGCDHCNNTGYVGRVGTYEVLPVEGAVRDALASKRPVDYIRAKAVQNGMISINHDGYRKAQQGITTLEEILHTHYE